MLPLATYVKLCYSSEISVDIFAVSSVPSNPMLTPRLCQLGGSDIIL